MSKRYDSESIQSLSFIEGVRKRVGMYLGSADNDGVLHGLVEIVNNSVDEAISGYGNEIKIIVGDDWYSVEDKGRGIPVGANKDVKDVLVSMLTSIHSGGKFDGGSYKTARGLNGVGSGVVSASSSKLLITSKRDGFEWHLETVKGVPKTETTQKGKKTSETGTYVKAYPDPEVFNAEKIKLDFNEISDLIKEYAYFSSNCKFIVIEDKTKKKNEYHFKNGLKDFADEKIKNSLHKNYIYNKIEEDGVEVEIIAQWTRGREKIYTFVNGGDTPEGGTPTTGLKSAITTRINSELGVRIDGNTIRKGLVAVISIKHPAPIFGNQTKTKISNPELRGLASKAILEGLDKFKNGRAGEYTKLLEIIQKTEQAERAADKAREQVLSTEKEILSTTNRRSNMDLPSKVADATNKTGYRELYLSEGDSASAYLISTRDSATQGVMPLRGKILNTYDLELHEAYKNEEVKAIFTLLGSGAGSLYNAKKLRYEKVIIAADADPDGNHIAILVIGLFLRHTPQLIADGKLYKLVAPFYGVGKGKNYKLLYSEQELKDYEAKHGKQADMDRFKGLGAMSEEMTGEILMNPKNRKLEQITMKDLEEMRELFDTLLGKDIDGRRYLVSEGKLYE